MPADHPLRDTVATFLRAHAPFDQMAEEPLLRLASSMQVRYFPPGDTLLAPADGAPGHVWIVHRGRVERSAPDELAGTSGISEPL